MTGTLKAYKGLPMEGVIASWYAENTARDLRRFVQIARQVSSRVQSGSRILEVAPGPGYLAIELARRGYELTAVDISRSFVRIARENAEKAGVRVDVRHGNAAAMPFAEGSFDFIVCSAAFKNFSEPVVALNEMHRVLKPGGQAAIYDLRKEATREEIDAEVRNMGLSAPNAMLTRLIFRHGLLKRAYTREMLQRMTQDSRFRLVELLADGIGFELRLTKERGADQAGRV